MRAVSFPNGLRVILDNVFDYQVEGNTVKMTGVGVNDLYTATTLGSAQAFLPQIDAALEGTDNTVTAVTETALTWTSITPNTGSNNTPSGGYAATVAGNGFDYVQVTGMRLYNAGGTILLGITVNSSTSISVNNEATLTPALVYTVQYTPDNGVTWSNCGSLTVTVS